MITPNRSRRPVKAMFFDVDGTLLSFETHRIPDSAVEALAWARKQGVLLFVATGRHKASVMNNPQIRAIGFDGFVTLNGQYCFNGRQVLFSNPIDPRDVAIMVRYVEEHPFPCLFLEAEEAHITRVDDVVRMVHEEINDYIPPVREARLALERDIFQICLYTPDSVIPPIVRELENCAVTSWFSNGMDIVPKSGNKWVGIAAVLRHYGLRPEETAVFGDSTNDLEMLAGAGYPIAMGNAAEPLKQLACHITGDVEHDGVAKGIHYLLG